MLELPVGTNVARPTGFVRGMLRPNEVENRFEIYTGERWIDALGDEATEIWKEMQK